MRHLLLAAALLTLNGCCTLMPGTYGTYERCMDPHRYDKGFTNEFAGTWTVPKAAPRCTDVLFTTMDTLTPCDGLRPLHGVVRWREKPFDCYPPFGQMVWGCATLGKPYISMDVALPPSGHASDSAVAEEAAHWIWAKCFPTVKTEWTEVDPKTGKTLYVRDPAFQKWFMLARTETRAVCP